MGELLAAKQQLVDNNTRAFTLIADDPALSRLLFRQAGGVLDGLASHLDAFFGGIAALAERSLRAGQSLGLVKTGDVRLLARLALGLFKEAALSLDQGHAPSVLATEVLDRVLFGVRVPKTKR